MDRKKHGFVGQASAQFPSQPIRSLPQVELLWLFRRFWTDGAQLVVVYIFSIKVDEAALAA
jgi:hypothetical protein